MVDPKEIDTMNTELENRLDDLFGENDHPTSEASFKELGAHYPLVELKNLILSIDWEITDEVLDSTLQQLKDLLLTYKHDKIVTTFLQILNSLTNYIKTHRAKAHPKTFKILNSVFASLDKVVLSRDMTELSKKRILRAEMNRYKELRAAIAKSKAAAVKRTVKSQPVTAEPSETKAQSKEPTIDLREPSNVVEFKAQAEPVLEQDEAEADSTDQGLKESPILLAESSHPASSAVDDGISDKRSESQQQTELASLTEAVDEIKRFIQTEIAALKEEIQALREQR